MRTIGTSLAMCGLPPGGRSSADMFRDTLRIARQAGCGAVQIDGTMAGLRARDLDRSARRDIAALIRRQGMLLSGIDLWIPAEHTASAVHVDRAVRAVIDGCLFASELAKLTESANVSVCVSLNEKTPDAVRTELARGALSAGVHLADVCHGVCELHGVCIDPAAEMFAGRDPVESIVHHAKRVADARLNDTDRIGRCPVGEGRLSVAAYRAVIETVTPVHWMVIDTRGLANPSVAITAAIDAWTARD